MKWKYFGYICAIGILMYLLFIFCESMQDNGVAFTFHYCLRALLIFFECCLFFAVTVYLFTSPPKFLTKIATGNTPRQVICIILYLAIYIIITIGFMETTGALNKKYDNYIYYKKFIYRLERNIY